MLSNSNQVFFELTLRDSLTNNLQSVIGKGVSSLKQLDVAGSGLGKSLMSSLGGLSTLLPLAGLTAVGSVLASATQKGMEFTKAMSGVRALLLATDDEFSRLNQSAISLGASTVYSSTQIAEAMQVAASAGQNTNENYFLNAWLS